MEIIRDGGIAIWRQIRQILEREIRERVFKPGDRLPTEAELARRFMVNRHTVRQALAQLEERGLLRTDQGRGTFVQEAVIDYQVSRKTRFSENLSRQNRSADRVLHRAHDVQIEEAVEKAHVERGRRIRRQEANGSGMHELQVFDDDAGLDDRPVAVDEHRHLAQRPERPELALDVLVRAEHAATESHEAVARLQDVVDARRRAAARLGELFTPEGETGARA